MRSELKLSTQKTAIKSSKGDSPFALFCRRLSLLMLNRRRPSRAEEGRRRSSSFRVVVLAPLPSILHGFAGDHAVAAAIAIGVADGTVKGDQGSSRGSKGWTVEGIMWV